MTPPIPDDGLLARLRGSLLRNTRGDAAWRRGIQLAVIAVYAWALTGAGFAFHATLATVSFVAALAIAYSLVLGYLNIFNFGQHAAIGLAAYAFAIVTTRSGSVSVGVLAGCLAAVLLLVLVAALSVRLTGFQLGLVSISIGTVFLTALTAFTDLTGGSSGISGFPSWLDFSPLETRQALLVSIGVLVGVALSVSASMSGRAGRLGVTIGDDEFLARVVGTNVVLVRVLVSAWCGLLTGLVATLWVQEQKVVVPNTYGLALLIQIFLVLMVGGRRSIWGPVAASMIVVGIPGWVSGLDGDLLTIIFALLVVLVVVRKPDGLYPQAIRDRSPRLRSTRGARRRTALRRDPRRIVGIEAQGLAKRFGEVRALAGVDARFPPGSITAVIGSNGSGKTTLLNCLSGIWKPDDGRILLAEASGEVRPARRASAHSLARHGLGRSFQVPRLAPGLTVRDNVRLARDGWGERATDEEVDEVIARWGLGPWLDRRVSVLPHGVRRWVELARLDLGGADVLLLDEPAAGLADDEMAGLVAALQRWRSAGRCIVLVEHNHALVEALADTTIVMANGRVVGVGSLSQLRARGDLDAVIGTGP